MSSPVEISLAARRPPYSEDAEQAVLSAMLQDEAAVAKAITIVNDTDFYREAHRRIFRAIAGVFSEGAAGDPLSVAEKLDSRGELKASGGKDYIGELIDVVPSGAHVEHHAKIVKERAERRRLLELASRIEMQAHDLGTPPVETAQMASRDLLPVAADTKGGGFVKIGREILTGLMEEIEKRRSGQSMAGLSFGYREIDERTGGLRPGELVFVAGVPGCGKTALLLNIAARAAVDRHEMVAIISAEMGTKSLVERLLNAGAQVETVKTRRGELAGSEFVRLGKAAGSILHAPLYVDDTATPRLSDIRAKCRALKAEHPELKLVLLDFIQLVGSDSDSEENRALQLTTISYGLKGLSKEIEVGVIATCQVDAAAIEKSEDKRPRLSMLRWSQAMREAGDMIGLVYRGGMYDTDAPPIIEINWAKMRDLEPFVSRHRWTGKFMLVEDL